MMAAQTWAQALSEQLQTDRQHPGEKPGGIWQVLNQRIDPIKRRPQANPHVVSRELRDHTGAYHVLKNTEARTYLRLTPEQFRIWSRMDGLNTVEDLMVEHYMTTGSFAHAMISRLVADLDSHRMLCEPYIRAWQALRAQVEQRGLLYRLSAPARFILNQKLALHNIDTVVERIYRGGGWLLFTRPMQVLWVLLSVAGVFAFRSILANPDYVFIGENYISGLAYVWLASILPVLIHELGHALTVKHFGREVPRGGLMLFFGMPAAFVETTDIWMEPRRARLAVTWNGPYTGLILGGLVSLVIFFFPGFSLNSFFFKMAGFAYLTVFMNINPLLKYDGYYILSDALEISSLRERSLAFVRGHLLKRLTARKGLTRDEWIMTIYGVLSLVWTGYALYFMAFFWSTRVLSSIRIISGSGYPPLYRILTFILAAGILSFVFLLLLGLIRLVQGLASRFVRSGGLARHGRLAVYLALLAAALAWLLPYALKDPLPAAKLLIALIPAMLLWRFSRPFSGSLRGLSLRVTAFGIALGGLQLGLVLLKVPFTPLLYMLLASILTLLISWLILGWRTFKGLGLFPLAAGVLAGILTHLAFNLLEIPAISLVLAHLITIVGVWNIFSLSGGARAPAVALITLGALTYILSWHFILPLGSLSTFAAGLMGGGALHWVYAELPHLSEDETNVSAARTQEAFGLAVGVIVRRVIAQVFFETGLRGVRRFGSDFTSAMENRGADLRIEGNRFFDAEFSHRTVLELTEVYGGAFDFLHGQLCRELGSEMGSLAFDYGMDRLPWQNREVILELILSRVSWSSGISQRHEEGKGRRLTFLKRVLLFNMLGETELAQIAEKLETEHFASGDSIIRQGDAGDRFYIIERGTVSFWRSEGAQDSVRLQEKGPGQYFGEVALVADQPRNASVLAETPVTLLSLKKEHFDTQVRALVSLKKPNAEAVRRSWLLRSMPIFDELESVELDWLAINMHEERLSAGEIVFKEGDPGDRFYIVEEGEMVISRLVGGVDQEVSRLKMGEYFGEIALLQETPRTATITAASYVILLSLGREDFIDLLSGYTSFGKAVSITGSRRMHFIEAD